MKSLRTELEDQLSFAKREPDYEGVGLLGEWEREQMAERFNRNVEIEQQLLEEWSRDASFDGHINGQGRDIIKDMSFGPAVEERIGESDLQNAVKYLRRRFQEEGYGTMGTVGFAGCEAIAIYNALHDLGFNVSLSRIIYDIEYNNYDLAFGWGGTWVNRIDDMLRYYGAEVEKTSASNIQTAADNGELKEGQVFVTSFWTDSEKWISSIHTVEVVYSPQKDPDNPWIVYNVDNEKEEAVPFESLDSFFGGKKEINFYKVTG